MQASPQQNDVAAPEEQLHKRGDSLIPWPGVGRDQRSGSGSQFELFHVAREGTDLPGALSRAHGAPELISENPEQMSAILIRMIDALCDGRDSVRTPDGQKRSEKVAAACRRMIERGATLAFPNEASAAGLRHRIYACPSVKQVMEVLEFAWRTGSERTQLGIRELTRKVRMRELVRKYAPALAKKLRSVSTYTPISASWLRKRAQWKQDGMAAESEDRVQSFQ
jgi:hypothetical protein